MFLGEVAGGEEKVVVDLDWGELREFVVEKGDGGDGGSADFDFVRGIYGNEMQGVDEGRKLFIVRNEVKGAESLGDLVVGATGEVAGVDGDIFKVMANEEEVGGEELGEFVEVDGLEGWLGGCGIVVL